MLNSKSNKKIAIIGLPILSYILFSLFYGGSDQKIGHIEGSFKRPIYFAEKGISKHLPENSMMSIEVAKIKGFKGLEVDVRKTADGEFVLFNDANCKRLLGINKELSDLSAAEVLTPRLHKKNKPSSSSVLMLKQLFKDYGDDFIIYIDLKLDETGDAKELAALIIENELTASVIVSNPNLSLIAGLENEYPEIMTCLSDFKAGDEWSLSLVPFDLEPDFTACKADDLDQDHASWIRKNKLMGSKIIYDVNSGNIDLITMLEMQNVIVDYDLNHILVPT